MDVCFVKIEGKLNLHSDVTTLTFHPNPDLFSPSHSYPFPLGGVGPYLCTQSYLFKFKKKRKTKKKRKKRGKKVTLTIVYI
jgi:hypothetical protein